MNPYRKIISQVCIVLVLFTSFTWYSGAMAYVNSGIVNGSDDLFFVSQTPPQYYFLHEKSSTAGIPGYEIEVAVHGYLLQGSQQTETPRLKTVRKIFVVNPGTFTSCKSFILYPFHEFS